MKAYLRQETLFWEQFNPSGFLRHLRNSSRARHWCRNWIQNAFGIQSIVEVGVGGLNERIALHAFLQRHRDVAYVGYDCSTRFIENAKRVFPRERWVVSDVQSAPPDSADLVYSQHVLEHCAGLSPALSNMLSSARKYFLNIFFIPLGETDSINSSKYPLYENSYARDHVERVCRYHGFQCEFRHFDSASSPNAPLQETVLLATRSLA